MAPHMWKTGILALACLGKLSQAENRSNEDRSDDAAAYLQSSVQKHSAETIKADECAENDHVQCPDSGAWCHGMQCCPSVGGEPNYPCPSAPPGWGVAHCQSGKKKMDCTGEPVPVQQCQVGDHVHCGDGDPFHMCAGNQCCEAADGFGSYPCPSAEYNFGPGHCQHPTKLRSCLPPHIFETCQYKVDVNGDAVEVGIARYKNNHPLSSDLIHTYHSTIKNTVVNKTCPLDDDAMRNETYPALVDLIAVAQKRIGGMRARRGHRNRMALKRAGDNSPVDCVTSVASAIIDTVGFVFAILGGEAVDAALTADEELPRVVGSAIDEFIKEFTDIFEEIGKKWGERDFRGVAKGVWDLVDTVHEKIGSFQLFFDALKHDLSWWEWVCIGIALLSQLLVWIGTDGAAAVLEILELIQAEGSMIDSINSAVQDCSGSR